MKKILIADDDVKIRNLVRSSLATLDMELEIQEAKNGQETIQKAKEWIPHVIILDIMMPGGTGYEICQQIKANHDTKDVKVLFLTGFKSAATAKTARTHGGDALVNKPFEVNDLLEKIKDLLAKG